MANVPIVTDLSGTGGTLARGPESRFVVDAVASVLDGDAAGGRRHLADGARATSWAAVLHRLDVAGRALALDAGLRPADAVASARQALALDGGAPAPVVEDVVRAWSAGEGLPVAIDLAAEAVDPVAEDERALAACLVCAWLVDASGFPPEVVV